MNELIAYETGILCATTGFGKMTIMDSINDICDTKLNTTSTAEQISEAIRNSINDATADLGTMEIKVNAAIAQVDSDISAARAQYNNAVSTGMPAAQVSARLDALKAVEAQKEVLVGVQQSIKVQTQATKIVSDYKGATSREDVRAAQQAAVDLAKKESN